MFQLRSHAYLYASIPQHVIDEESHPGILAHLGSSSSSSSSSRRSSVSSSSSSSSSSSGGFARSIRDRLRRMSQPDHEGRNSGRSSGSGPASPNEDEQRGRPLFSEKPPIAANGPEDDIAVFDADEIIPHPVAHGTDGTADINVDEENKEAITETPELAKAKISLRAMMVPKLFSKVSSSPMQPAIPTQGIIAVEEPTTRPIARRAASLPPRLTEQVSPQDMLPYMVPLNVSDESLDDTKGKLVISRTTAIVLLLCSTALVAVCAEFMVSSIDAVISTTGVSEAFIGLILLPIVGNAAEHVTAVTVAAKNKMDLAIGVAVGSSIQIALFVTPLIVLLGWILDKDMGLYFNIFETVALFTSCFVVNFLVLDGRSNYLEGALLCASYVIIAVAAYFYPNDEQRSSIGAGPN
ncbi:hypothetical protein AA313_de0202513 [Arthrobotrys entomopaga]|nr:hypothetical protein AA313_de0202513 [Arthrobotrys entomopaga]